MKMRTVWIQRIEDAWKKHSVVWLSGVRRVGKTMLCQSLPDIEYFDCELPRTRRLMEDPEGFLGSLTGKRVVLDEIHRLAQPSQLLKIASDHFPGVRIVATGSSTLGASSKFRDTLTGRKSEVWLTPMIAADLVAFGKNDLPHRLQRGGLPPFFMARTFPEKDYPEWMDAYWAKDIQELFRLERRYSFLRFVEMILASSGGIFEATRFARPCEVSRTSITNYLAVLEATMVAHVVRPFSGHYATEIVSAPKVYGFDTGFVCAFRGWQSLRPEDMSLLWEHFVLNELQAVLQTKTLHYWRNKQGQEIDFVLVRPGHDPLAIECKRSANEFDATSLHAFRNKHPRGENFVVAMDVERSYRRESRGVAIWFVSLTQLCKVTRQDSDELRITS
jgi:predicted AAA+ superfamily ATPase